MSYADVSSINDAGASQFSWFGSHPSIAASSVAPAGRLHDLGNLTQVAASALNIISRAPEINASADLKPFSPVPFCTFYFRASADLPDVTCNPLNLRSAFINLSFNARDALPDGGLVSITAHLFKRREDAFRSRASAALAPL